MSPCSFAERYRALSGQVEWVGSTIADDADLRLYLAGPVRDRLVDEEVASAFATELLGLATTRIGTATVEAVLNAAPSPRLPWEIGEALAECLLVDHRGAVWPWNTERDKRTPRASLPGADLIGFVVAEGGKDAVLAIGEVKTSSDTNAPPNVMSGRSGMVHQLQRFQDDPELQGTVLKWLRVRCHGTEHWEAYQSAVQRFLDSAARDVILFGVLMRDTEPNECDLEARGRALADATGPPTAYELTAWYMPHAADHWPDLVGARSGAEDA
jgi:hypothetical protein